jgi:hypothetical protein
VIAQVKAELLKFRSTRTTLGLVAGMIVLTLLIVLLTGLLTHPSGLSSNDDQRNLFAPGGASPNNRPLTTKSQASRPITTPTWSP